MADMKFLKPKLFLKNFIFAVLLIGIASALYQLAVRYPWQWDFTLNASNSLDTTSVDVLKQLPNEIKLTVYATGQDANLGDMHRLISDFVALYQRYKPNITLTFIDPLKQPDEARKINIQSNGEMVVEYDGRREHLTMPHLNEQSLTGLLMRLAHSKDQLLMYLDGHGERKLEGNANHDLGEFGKKLQQNGFRLSSLDLTLAQDVPENASMLLITQPQFKLLPGEVEKLLRYVARGGNLLWLVDAEPLQGLESVAEKLGLLLTPGLVVDPAAAEMNIPTNWTLGAGYPPHAITQNFSLITVFPYARALDWMEGKEWHHTILVEAAPRGWISRQVSPDKALPAPRFNKKHDIPGPVTVAMSLQREINEREQRIVIVGSGSFLANAYSGNGGNLDLGVNMINWLAHEENLITIQPRAVKDGSITLSRSTLSNISVALLIVLPALLLLVGGVMWWRRRR